MFPLYHNFLSDLRAGSISLQIPHLQMQYLAPGVRRIAGLDGQRFLKTWKNVKSEKEGEIVMIVDLKHLELCGKGKDPG